MEFFTFNKEMDMDKVMELLKDAIAKMKVGKSKMGETLTIFPYYTANEHNSTLDRLRPRKRINSESMECFKGKRSRSEHFPSQELNGSNYSDGQAGISPARKKLYSPGAEDQFFME